MPLSFFVLLFGLQHTVICITDTSERSVKDIELVHMLKQDLRKHNDDYIDKFNDSNILPVGIINKKSGADNVAKTNDKTQDTDEIHDNNVILQNDVKDANRRKNHYRDELNKYSFSPETFNPAPTVNPKRFNKVSKEYDKIYAQMQSVATIGPPKFIKTGNADKFKSFIAKNKGLLQRFIKHKQGEESQERVAAEVTDAVGLGGGGAEADGGGGGAESDGGGGVEPRAQPWAAGGPQPQSWAPGGPQPQPWAAGGPQPRAHASQESVPALGARQLDMAPARGGRIHSMRLKGRLCERSVLMPEGPKYDSRGRVYLPAYQRRARQRDYPHTRAPRLVLPKCCNCCKKSVLGCE